MRVLFCSLLSLWTYRNSHVENGTHKRIKYVGYLFLLQQHDNFPENLAPSSPRMCNMGHVHILWMKKIQTGRNESSPLEKGKCVCVRPVQSFKIKFTKLIYIVPWSKLERASYVCVTMKIVYWLENSLQQYLPSSNVILLSENFKLISIIFKKKKNTFYALCLRNSKVKHPWFNVTNLITQCWFWLDSYCVSSLSGCWHLPVWWTIEIHKQRLHHHVNVYCIFWTKNIEILEHMSQPQSNGKCLFQY